MMLAGQRFDGGKWLNAKVRYTMSLELVNLRETDRGIPAKEHGKRRTESVGLTELYVEDTDEPRASRIGFVQDSELRLSPLRLI